MMWYTRRCKSRKRLDHVARVPYFQRQGHRRPLAFDRYGQVGPRHKRHPAVGVVTHVRIVTGSLAAVKIYRVRPPAQSLDAVPVLLAVGHARVLGLQAVEPAALICDVEDGPGYQCPDPDGEIVSGGEIGR